MGTRVHGAGSHVPVTRQLAAHPETPLVPPVVSSALTPNTIRHVPDLGWAGYVAVGSSGFDFVSGDWIVPCYAAPDPANSGALQWVGLGGYGANHPLFQGGTETDPTSGYTFWWEDVGSDFIQYGGPPVHCGDQVFVNVDYGLTCAGKSYIYLYDFKSGLSWTPLPNCLNFTPDRTSAEWIDERPGCSLTQPKHYKLTNFQHTTWTYAKAASSYVRNNTLEPLAFFSRDIMTMEDSIPGTVLAEAGTLGSDAMTHTDTWDATGTSTC